MRACVKDMSISKVLACLSHCRRSEAVYIYVLNQPCGLLYIHPLLSLKYSPSHTLTHTKVGDGTNFVLILSGALIANAEELLKMGLSPSEVAEGYETACEKALNILPGEWVWLH